jgi:tetratricopeptide (TPR) repeat protein
MKTIHSLAFILVAAGLVGCASHNNSNVTSNNSQASQATPDPRDVPLAPAPKLSSNTYFAAGQFAETQGKPQDALKHYIEALKADPNNLAALYRTGVVYTELKQYDQAVNTWQKYIRQTNNAADAYGNLGFTYELAGRPADAEAAYQAGIARDPENILCRTNFGLMRAREDRVEEALKIWKPVLTDAEMHYNLGSVYQLEGRKLEAQIEYQKALDLDPKMEDAKSRLASCE